MQTELCLNCTDYISIGSDKSYGFGMQVKKGVALCVDAICSSVGLRDTRCTLSFILIIAHDLFSLFPLPMKFQAHLICERPLLLGN